MKVGDLVRFRGSSKHLAFVISASHQDPLVFVKMLKTGRAAWVNKFSVEALNESR